MAMAKWTPASVMRCAPWVLSDIARPAESASEASVASQSMLPRRQLQRSRLSPISRHLCRCAGMKMTCRFDPLNFNAVRGPGWAPRGLVSPRACRCLDVCKAGPDATAVHHRPPHVHRGWTSQGIDFNREMDTRPPVHPPDNCSTHMRACGCADACLRVCTRVHSIPLPMVEGGRMDGTRIHAGLRRPPLVHRPSNPIQQAGGNQR